MSMSIGARLVFGIFKKCHSLCDHDVDHRDKVGGGGN